MDIDVEYVLNMILGSLTVENTSDRFFTNTNSNINSVVKFSESEERKKLNVTEVSESQHEIDGQLEVNSIIFKDIFTKSSESRKSSDGHNATSSSSEFEDLIGIKANVSIKESSDQLHRIITSTPKKTEDANREISRKKRLNDDTDNSSDDSFVLERNHDYLDTTIEEAINRYERREEKFKDISMQTNADELLIKCSNCLQNIQTKKEPLTSYDVSDSPPFKKIKNDNNLIRPQKNARKIIEVTDYKNKTDGSNNYWLNEAKEKIIDQVPISVSTVISVGRETFEPSKPLGIRVGLSRRIKPRKDK